MKKRLRKKLHRGEFRELGFSFDAKFKADTEMQVVEAWLQELASLLNAHSLEMGGGWNSNVCGGFITRERGSVTPVEQDIVRKWFEEHGQNLESITVGELNFIVKYYIFVCVWGCIYSPKFVRFSWVVYAQLLFRVNMNRVCDFIG